MTIYDGDDPIALPGNVVRLFLLQLTLIIVFSKILGKLIRYVHQPTVVAEMIGGILLGPSAFSAIPAFKNHVFPTGSLPTLNVIANFGLILYLFLIGLETDITVVKKSMKKYLLIATIGVIVPFIASIPVGYLIFGLGGDWIVPKINFGTFLLFIGIAFAVSSLPVLARILAETHMLYSDLGSLTLITTVIDDIEAYILLAVVIAIAQATSHLNVLWTLLATIGQILCLLFIVKPIFNKIADRVERTRNFSTDIFFTIIVILLVFAFFTDVIGLSTIFGAFEIGVIVPRNPKVLNPLLSKMQDIVNIFFLPIYFTYSGLKTELGTLNNGVAWGVFFLMMSVSFIFKAVGIAVPAKIIGKLTTKEAVAFGCMLQTKGMSALILINIGYDSGVITTKFFSVCVLLVVVSTLITTPLVEYIYPAQKMLEETLRKRDNDDSYFCGVLPVTGKKNAALLVTVLEPVIKGRKDNYSSVTEVFHFITEDGSRDTASYLGTWYQQKKNQFSPALKSARKTAQKTALKINCHSIVVKEGKQIDTLINVVNSTKADLVLIGADLNDEGDDATTFEGSLNLETETLQALRSSTLSPIGVVIRKNDRIYLPTRIESILIPIIQNLNLNTKQSISDSQNDMEGGIIITPSAPSKDGLDEVLKLASLYARAEKMNITLFRVTQNVEESAEEVSRFTSLCTANSAMKFKNVNSEYPIGAILKEMEKAETHMVLLPFTFLENKQYAKDLYNGCRAIITVLYPSVGERPERERSDSITQLDSSSEFLNSKYSFRE